MPGNRCHRGRNQNTANWRGVAGRGGVGEPGVRIKKGTQGTRETLLCPTAENTGLADTGMPTAKFTRQRAGGVERKEKRHERSGTRTQAENARGRA
jgi:hypothetical protein